MKKSSSFFSHAAFTLIELLVVIAIIGILGGLMYPATTGALRRAERTHAENTAYNLKNAISAYFTEYRKYPVRSDDNNEESERRTDHELMDILLGADSQKQGNQALNPRAITFYTDKSAKPMGDGKYRKGINLSADGGGELWDPWGEYYYVRMDLDYNNRIQRPAWDDAAGSSQYLPEAILVWSSGADKQENTAKDNIKTW